ncbi:MAG TPA: tetratricopeptide repeat protein, partial [Verrucomicrobiae bacterium]|nr:tetratricopeptide repeat protein [Verrucomicrobiae bacterium]
VKEAAQLRRQARFREAESVLKSLLQKNPGHVEAAMMLMRIYSQDLRQPAQARQILQTLKQQPHVSAAVIEFAERSLYDWDRPTPPKPEEESLPDSVEELLARRLFGTAIELLKRQLKDRPNDFELTLKLAEIQACHCQNPMAAEKIVRQMEGRFSRDQIQTARARLKEWQ